MTATVGAGKSGKRRANRVVAMQLLYTFEMNRSEPLSGILLSFFADKEEERPQFEFAEELFHGTVAHLQEIDERIAGIARNWDFKRIAKVDLAILRLAVFELLYRPDIPPVVTINEAVELGKLYSNDDSRRFLNGVLDKLSGTLQRPLREGTGAGGGL